VRTPKILVSEIAVSALNGLELHAALRHEFAHVRHRDNLKKLVFQFSPFPGMKRLERAWSEAAEMDADDAAVSNLPEALDLAAALIKLSRLAPVQTPELAAGLLHNPACSVSARVDRLFRWDESRIALNHRSRAWYAFVPTLAIGACVLLTYNSVLTGMHTVTEWLVR
jgi:Zn-dependent protease with chaperone function